MSNRHRLKLALNSIGLDQEDVQLQADLVHLQVLIYFFASAATPAMICRGNSENTAQSNLAKSESHPCRACLRSLGGELWILPHKSQVVLLGNLEAGNDTRARFNPVEPRVEVWKLVGRDTGPVMRPDPGECAHIRIRVLSFARTNKELLSASEMLLVHGIEATRLVLIPIDLFETTCQQLGLRLNDNILTPYWIFSGA